MKMDHNTTEAALYLESVGYLRIRGVNIQPATCMEFRDVEGQKYIHLHTPKEVEELAKKVRKELDLPLNWRIDYGYHAQSGTRRYFIQLKVDGAWLDLMDHVGTAPINFLTRDAAIERVQIEAEIRRTHPRYRKATYPLYGLAI